MNGSTVTDPISFDSNPDRFKTRSGVIRYTLKVIGLLNIKLRIYISLPIEI
jgi:hypothetical protein